MNIMKRQCDGQQSHIT